MTYSAEDKRRIREESRRLLDELEAERAFQADVSSDYRSPAWIEELLGPSDPLEKWRHGQLKAEAERAAYRQREAADTNERRSRDWDHYVRAHIERALAEHDRLWIKSIGQVVGEERKYMHDYVDYVAKQLRVELAKTRGVSSDVVDLPVVRKITDSSAA